VNETGTLKVLTRSIVLDPKGEPMKTSSAAVALSILLIGCTSQQPSTEAQATASASGTATQPGAAIPFAKQERGQELRAGTYVLRYADIGGEQAFPTLAITFTVPHGWDRVQVDGLLWSDAGMRLGFAVVDNLYVDPCDPDRGLRDPAVGPSVDDLTRALATVPGWKVAGEVSDDEFSGFAGSRIELTGPADLSGCVDESSRLLHILGAPGYAPAISGSEHHELRILNVQGTRLVIYAATETDTLDANREELETVLNSIQIEA
jgi:hypothetical protein